LSKSVFKAANKGSRRKSFKSPSRSGKKEKLRDRETEREKERRRKREREREREGRKLVLFAGSSSQLYNYKLRK
jgi:uncharacterized membrane protein YdbT with pleckstrin-like domain